MTGLVARLKAGGSAESVLAGLVGQALLLVSGVIIARALGPEDRGHFAMLVVIGALAAQLVLAGMPQAVTFYLSRRSGAPARWYAAIRRAASFQAILSLVLCASLLYFYTKGAAPVVILAAVAVVLAVPASIAMAYSLAGLLGQGRYRRFHVLRTLPAAAWAMIAIALYMSGWDGLLQVVVAWSVAQLAVSWAIWRQFAGAIPRTHPQERARRVDIVQLLRHGARGMIGYLSLIDTFRIDQIAVGVLLSPAALGIYVVAQALTNLPRLVARSVGFIAFPTLASSPARNASASRIYHYLWVTNVLMLPLVVVLFIFMPVVVEMLFGESFADATPIARVLIIAALFAANRRVVGEIFRGLGLPQYSTWLELLSVPVLALAMIFLVPMWGIVGMAVAVAVTHCTGCTTAFVLLARYCRLMSRRVRDEPELSRSMAG